MYKVVKVNEIEVYRYNLKRANRKCELYKSAMVASWFGLVIYMAVTTMVWGQ